MKFLTRLARLEKTLPRPEPGLGRAAPPGVKATPTARPGRAAAWSLWPSDRAYLASSTFRVQRLSPGPRLRISRVYVPASFGVNFTSQSGPGLSSLVRSFLLMS